jgi:hypothetical protein
MRPSSSRNSTGSVTLAETAKGVGVDVEHPLGCRSDTASVRATGDVLAPGPTGGVLHRAALNRSALSEGGLLVLGQPKRHRHHADGIELIPLSTPTGLVFLTRDDGRMTGVVTVPVTAPGRRS